MLTDDEIDRITRDRWGTQLLGEMVQAHREYARAIEAAIAAAPRPLVVNVLDPQQVSNAVRRWRSAQPSDELVRAAGDALCEGVTGVRCAMPSSRAQNRRKER